MNILLAEDDEKLGRLLVRLLQKALHQVDWVTNGHDAYQYAMSGTYDVIVLDWMMPQTSGIDVCAQLRTAHYDGAILFLTAKDAIEDRVHGLHAGADDYLVKPFEFIELEARLLALSRRFSHRYRPTTLQFASLTLNQATRQVMRGHDELLLTPRETQLVELLLLHAPNSVTREIIYERIWGLNGAVNDNAIDALVKLVRKKVDGPYRDKLIHNIRGIGYRIGGE